MTTVLPADAGIAEFGVQDRGILLLGIEMAESRLNRDLNPRDARMWRERYTSGVKQMLARGYPLSEDHRERYERMTAR